MPYDINHPPDILNKLPPAAKEIWIAAYNEAWKTNEGNDGACAAAAWAAVDREYQKDDRGNYAKMSDPLMNSIDGDLMICNTIDLNGVVPTEIQLMPFGRNESEKYGPQIVDDEALNSIMAEASKRKNDSVIDYEHQSLTVPPIAAPAAGWIKKRINKGTDGAWALVEWTDKAKALIAKKEYRYLSSVNLVRKSDRKVMDIIGAAPTNRPNIDGMVPLVNKFGIKSAAQTAKEETMWKELLKLLGLPEDGTEAAAMTAVNKMRDQINAAKAIVANKAVLSALGIADTAGEAEVVITINNLRAGNQIVANKNVLDALGLKADAGESEIVGTILAMKQAHQNIDQLTTQVNTLSGDITKRNADELVEMGMKLGKITPAQKDWALSNARRDPEGFKVFLNKAPVVMRFDKIAGEEKTGDVLDETQIKMNRLLGVSDKTWKEHHNKLA